MRRILSCVLFATIASAPLLAAQAPNISLASIRDLSQHGQYPQVIETANSLLANNTLAPTDRALALVYLGYAYQQRGEFTKATETYEKALKVIDHDTQYSSEYAATLASLATVYAQIGQIDTAKHVLLRSVHMFESENDHTGAAMIWNDLATIAADHNSRSEAHKDMKFCINESKLAKDMSPGERAALATTEGRISELDGDPRAAVSDYGRAVDLWRQTGQDQQQRTAWLYVLQSGAYLEAGDSANALATAKRGLGMLEVSSGRETPRYFKAELVYSKALDASGAHDEASTLRKQAQASLKTDTDMERARGQISVSALR